MYKQFNPYILKFVNKDDIVQEIDDGYSGALLYKIIRNKEKFLVKVFKGQFRKETIIKIKKILEIYKKLEIKSLDIIDYGDIQHLDKYYIVYNFIEGENLKKYTNNDKYGLKQVNEIGKYIGNELLKLKMYEDYDKELFKNEDIDIQLDKIIENFYSILEDKIYKDLILEFFSIKELDELKEKLVEFCYILKNEKPKLIHGDIKRSNIMVDNNKEFYIVDIESMQVNYDILNFKHQMTWCLFENNEKEIEFVKGYFDGIYNNTRPTNFNYNVIFIIILNFFNASYHMYKKADINNLRMYMQDCRKLFDRVNKINLDKEFII